MVQNTPWTLGHIAQILRGRLSSAADPDTVVNDFHVRAWSCRPGSVFLPIFRAGVEMADKAFQRGAVAVMTDAIVPDTVPHLWVPDLQDSARSLAILRRDEFSGQIIGITGSGGKSTTKTMLAHVLSQENKVFSTTNNQNLTPYITAALCSMHPENTFAVFEMAMFDIDMVWKSSKLARPHIGIITSIGMNHAEFHENPEEGIVQSKTELFWGLEPGSTAILPTQDEAYGRLRQRAIDSGRVAQIVTCGHDASDDVKLLDMDTKPTYSKVRVSVFGQEVAYNVPVPGIHMVNNSLLVAGALKILGQPLQVMQSLESYETPRSSIRRFHAKFPDKEVEIIDDAIISSPQQVRAMLQIISSRPKAKRRLFVFGDMTALGPEATARHEELAPEIEAAGVDKLIAVGKHSAQLAKKLTIPTVVYEHSFAAEHHITEHINDGDLVIFKASGPTNFKRILKQVYKEAKLTPAPMTWTIEGG